MTRWIWRQMRRVWRTRIRGRGEGDEADAENNKNNVDNERNK
jgi:hypothetical protein